MKITPFEAIAAHACKTFGISLIMDLDGLCAGVCRRDESGEFSLLGTTAASCKKSLYQALCGVWRFLEHKNEAVLSRVNEAMKIYLRSEGALDTEAFSGLDGSSVSASVLAESFAPFEEKILHFSEECAALLEKLDIDEDDVRILMVGDIASIYPAVHTVKAYFSFDPFMEDMRFHNGVFSAKETEEFLVEMQKQEHRNAKTFEVEILCLSENGEKKQHRLLCDNRSSAFFGPVFAAEKEALTLYINGSKKQYFIPRELFHDGVGVFEFGITAGDGRQKLVVRRADAPMKFCEVLIDVIGAK